MNSKSLLYLVNIALLCTTIFGYSLTKNEVLNKNNYGQYYCKGEICVSSDNRIELGTIIIPNNEGKNVTYITDTCSMTDIDLDLCDSKDCTADSECLSNKCVKGHCSYNEATPIVHCQYVRTVHDDPLFGDPKGYKMQCGLPVGDTCETNNDCSSYNCVNYSNKKLCGEPDDSGCTSLCGNNLMGTLALHFVILPVIFIGILVCVCCFVVKKSKDMDKKGNDMDKKRNNEKDLSIV